LRYQEALNALRVRRVGAVTETMSIQPLACRLQHVSA
jgi:hypothetical protein